MRSFSLLALLVCFFTTPAFSKSSPTPYEAKCARLTRPGKKGDDSARLRRLFDVYWKHFLESSPEDATADGFDGYNDRWTDWSEAAVATRRREVTAPLSVLESIDRTRLGEEDRLSYDLLKWNLETYERIDRFPNEFFAINQLEGVQQDAARILAIAPHRNEKDYADQLARLEKLPALIAQVTTLLERGLKQGVTPPRVTLRDVPDQVQSQCESDAEKNPLLTAFRQFPDTIPSERRMELKAKAARVLKEKVIPAFQKLHQFLVEHYVPNARTSFGISALSDGKTWYAERARGSTTTDLSPQAIHEIGLREVARIHAEMEAVQREAGFKGSFKDFLEFLRTDSKFFFKDKTQLVMAYRDIAKRIDPGLIRLFGKLPRLPYGVEPVPEYSEKSQTTGYYEPGSPDAGRAGNFFCNTYALDTRPKWEMEALTLHEAVPGHHLQIALAQEMEGVPNFRKYGGYSAFVEGWGLYAEGLGRDLGLYRDPYAHFGQLTYDMWRAVRLVVDTGLHSMGWSRDQAIQYFKENTPKTEHDIEVEVDRYLVWPGQALAYKIGQLTIQKLRDEAKRELGGHFDIRAFHDEVLRHGAIPMSLLETQVHEWISKEKRTAR